jgi:hypothetical protein
VFIRGEVLVSDHRITRSRAITRSTDPILLKALGFLAKSQ